MRRRLLAQIGARPSQDVAADPEAMDGELRARLEARIHELEPRITRILAHEEILAAQVGLRRSAPGIGPVPAARRATPGGRNSAA